MMIIHLDFLFCLLCDKLFRADRERAEVQTAIHGIIDQVFTKMNEAIAARDDALERQRVEDEKRQMQEDQRKDSIASRDSVVSLDVSARQSTAQPSAASQPLTAPSSSQVAAASSAATAVSSGKDPIFADDFVPSREDSSFGELQPYDLAFVPEGLLFKFERAALEKKKWHTPSSKIFKVLGIVGEMHGDLSSRPRDSWDVPSCMIQWDKRPAYPVLQCAEGPSPQLQIVRSSPFTDWVLCYILFH